MELQVLVIYLLVVACSAMVPNASKFLGVGYNLLRGNPDGRESDNLGGVDPGLLVTRKILDISNPKATPYADRDSIVRTTNVYYGEKSYQKTLMKSVGFTLGGGLSTLLSGFSFSLSGRSAKAHNETNIERRVYFEKKTVTNMGRIRYAQELVSTLHLPVTINFAAAVCSLPKTYNEKAYMEFIEQWGTHVTMQVDYGKRTIDRYASTLMEFLETTSKQAGNGVSFGGSYNGFAGSFGMDFSKFESSSSYQKQFGSHQYTLIAGRSLPEPIGIEIATLDTLFDPGHWQDKSLCPGVSVLNSVSTWRHNFEKALTDYPKYTLAHKPTDQDLRIPITWPKGTYGLIKAKTGCPGAHVSWHEGYRKEDMEDNNPKNSWSSHHHFDAGFGKDIEIRFCMKSDVVATQFDRDWAPGTYCIYKYKTCPKGFKDGWIEMDDEDFTNHGSSGGAKPDGTYGKNTKIYYCCRNDGLPTHAIPLPYDKPFYLMMYGRQCQDVVGTKVIKEYISYDTEDNFLPFNVRKGGSHPTLDMKSGRYPTINFCYYYRNPSSPIIG